MHMTRTKEPGYNLAAYFCQNEYMKGGLCNLARKDITYKTVDLKKIQYKQNT
jgi:hypothetical protein